MPSFLFEETIPVHGDTELPLAAMLARLAVIAYLRPPGLHVGESIASLDCAQVANTVCTAKESAHAPVRVWHIVENR
jgi:hypothetical protein